MAAFSIDPLELTDGEAVVSSCSICTLSFLGGRGSDPRCWDGERLGGGNTVILVEDIGVTFVLVSVTKLVGPLWKLLLRLLVTFLDAEVSPSFPRPPLLLPSLL